MAAQVYIVAGPPRCGKTQKLMEHYRGALGSSSHLGAPGEGARPQGIVDCCWLGPNQSAINQLQDGLARSGQCGLLNPGLFTFARFADSLIQLSGRRIRAISTVQKRRLLSHCCRAALQAGELQHFAQVAETPGFITQLDQHIAELKRQDTWPEDYQQRCQRRPRSDRRSRELALLYAAYQQQLHQAELYDAEGRFWAARKSLEQAAAAELPTYAMIVVNGFNDFTTAQYDILRLLGERSGRMLISLTHEAPIAGQAGDGRELVFAKPSQTLDRLSELFPQRRLEYLACQPPAANSLADFQQSVFRGAEPETNDEPVFQGVEVVAASSELGEVESLARSIKQLLVSGTAQPEEIAVVHRGGDTALTRIAAVFPDFGIPFHVEQRPRLEGEPLLRTLQAVLRLVAEDWPFPILREVIGNRLLTRFDEVEGSAFDTQPRVVLEACLRSAQLPAGKDALLEQLSYRVDNASTDGGEFDERIAQLATGLKLLQQLDHQLAKLPEVSTIAEWLESIEQVLQQLGVFSLSNRRRTREKAAWRNLCRGLQAIAHVDQWSNAEPRLTLADLQALITAVAREQTVPTEHDPIGRVRLLSTESARKWSVPHLFLAGLNEQAFSAGATETNATVTDESSSTTETADVAEELVAAATPRTDTMLLFYELVTRPTKSLTLSYSALDSKGQQLPPSPLLSDLLRSVGADRVTQHASTLGNIGSQASKPLSRGDFRRSAVQQALEGKRRALAGMLSHKFWVGVGSSVLNGIDCVAQRGEREGFGSYEGLVQSEAARSALTQRFDSEHLWSASRLESYATCPFRFFGEQLLRLQPLNELALSNDARRRGSLLHQVLATIHEQLRLEYLERDPQDAPADADQDELVRRFLAALDAEVQAKPLRGIDQALREIERREIEAWAPNYAEQEHNYRALWNHLDEPPRPAHFEVRFGPETRSSSDDPSDRASTKLPFELELADERILLTGQIDRVDIGRMGNVTVFNIIDYKSGKAVKLSHDRVRSGHQLQLPLYALAAEQLLLADQKALALATGYWNIREKGFQTKNGGSLQLREVKEQAVADAAAWQDLQPELLDRVQQLIGGIRHGDFPVFNEDQHCTRSCELSTICRISQIRSLEKQWPTAENDCSKN